LIVDDEESIRTTIGAIAQKDGHTVSLASDAIEALDVLGKEPFDVVVSDIILPRKNGVVLLAEIRKAQPDVQVIMITGEPEVGTAAEAVRKGAFDYLSKPVSRDAISRVLAGAAARKALLDRNRRLEEENLKYRAHLEELVEERTEQLRDSEARYRTLFTNIADPVVIFDEETNRFLDCNQSALDCYGYTIDELRTMTPHDLHPVVEREQVDVNIADTEDLFPHQYTHVTKSGKEFPVEIHTTKLEYEGSPAWISIVRDISARRQAEDALHEEMAKAQQYLDVAGTMFVAIDTAGVVTLINQRGCEIIGYGAEDIVGKNWFDNFIPARLRAELLPVSKKLLAGEIEAAEYHESPVLTKSGEEKLIAWHNTILRDRQGDIVGYLSSGNDITERKQAEENLRDSEERLRVLFERAPDAYYLIDLKGVFVDGNEVAEELTGYGREELIGKSFQKLKLLSPKQLTRATALLAKNALGKDTGPAEFVLTRKDGSQVPVEIRTHPVKILGKTLVLGLARDITERKRAEERARRLLDQQVAINELSLALGEKRDLDSIYHTIYEHVSRMMGANAFVISFYDEEKQLLHAAYVQFDGVLFDVSQLPPIPLEKKGHGTQSEVIHTGEPLYLPDFRKARERGTTEYSIDDAGVVREGPPPDDADDIAQSALFVPLQVEGKAIGVMQVQSYHLDAYSQEDIDLLAGLANVAAVAVRDAQLVEEIEGNAKVLQATLDGIIQALAATTEARDPYTAGHQERVTQLACVIAEEMGIPDEQKEGIRVASLLHDIGKMSIPAEFLSKPTPLTEIEFSLIKNHPTVAHDILKTIDFPWPVADIVLQHHERLDGSGYPNGLKGEEILLEARIIAAADTVEAMSSHRPYRAAFGLDAALEEISKNKSTQYDPDVVKACLQAFEDGFRFEE